MDNHARALHVMLSSPEHDQKRAVSLNARDGQIGSDERNI